MKPILRVINYLFEKKSISEMADNIKDFFDNGINFPQFVALAFKVDEIPNFNPNPKSLYHRNHNNKLAYEYLLLNNANIKKISPDYSSEREQEILLSLILTKQVYNINYLATFKKVNSIVENSGITLHSINDLLDKKCLLNLLNTLTEGKIPIENDSNNFDEIMTKSFEIAKVPLVIDVTCLEIENQFLFFIQIEIIFEHFPTKVFLIQSINRMYNDNQNNEIESESDENNEEDETSDSITIMKEKKKWTHKIEYDESTISKEERIKDQAILDTINAIGKDCNLHFDNFYDAIKDDNLLKFVTHLFKNDESAQKILKDLIEKEDLSNDMKFVSVLKFLKNKESKFNLILFDFENPDYIESSSISLYTNLLDFFFLKKSKDELYDRCYTLLYGKYKKGDFMYEPYHEKQKILCNLNTYLMLIDFINNKRCRFVTDLADYFDQMLNDSKTSKVPMIINDAYLKSFPPKVIPNAVFYQLQFIFNELDSGDFPHRLVEYFLITIRKFSEIKVPPTDEITMSVRTKNISLILQKKRYKQNMQIQSKKVEDNDNNNPNESVVPKLPKRYLDRRNKKSSKKIREAAVTGLQLKKREIYEETSSPLVFKDGILFEYQLTSISHYLWDDFIDHTKFDRKKEKIMKSDFEPFFLKSSGSSPFENPLPIYKLYFYDDSNEIEQKWVINNDIYYDFWACKEETHSDDPLVLFLETQIFESLTLLNTINGRQSQKIDFDDSIAVYVVGNKKLSELKFDDTKLSNNENDLNNITPIFMFLYVPPEKQQIPNIRTIVFQIYAFLSMISDINIVILNAGKCYEQMDFITKIDELRHSYEIKNKLDLEINTNFDANENDYSNFEREEYDLDCEEDDYSDIEEELQGDIKKELLRKINPTLLSHKMKLFVLFNYKIEFYKSVDIKNARLFRKFKESLEKINNECYFIDVTNPKTYCDFINNFIKSALSINALNIKTKINLIEYFLMNEIYVDSKYDNNQIENLEINIHTRFMQLIDIQSKLYVNIHINCLTMLQNELFKSFPLLDNEYSDKINSILNSLKKQITNNQISFIIKELGKSSINHIDYINQLIESKKYWSDKQLNNIKNSHITFVKEEYFAIIQDLYPKKLLAVVYADNIGILENQINEDNREIQLIFNKVKKKQNQKSIREVDAHERTNYTIRERENEREVKVRIESGRELKDLLEQDF